MLYAATSPDKFAQHFKAHNKRFQNFVALFRHLQLFHPPLHSKTGTSAPVLMVLCVSIDGAVCQY
jgi:hypothetical protein